MNKNNGPARGPGRPKKLRSTPTKFGALLKEFRRGAGMSQAELAESAGVSTGYVGMMETGQRGSEPSVRVIFALAAALDLSDVDTERLLWAAGRSAAEATELMKRRGGPPNPAPQTPRQPRNKARNPGGSRQTADDHLPPATKGVTIRRQSFATLEDALEGVRAALRLGLGVNLRNIPGSGHETGSDSWILEVLS
jgi:transcriptional regulator with XRE-family HTH domain